VNTDITAVNNAPATVPVNGAWGAEEARPSDLVIPRLALAQAMSNPCKEGNAKPGEILHSQTNACVVPKGQELEILPILTVMSWVVSELVPGKPQPQFVRIEGINPSNDRDDWRFEKVEQGKNLLYQKRLSALVLPVNALDGFPYFVDFQKTSRKPGQVLSTIIQENAFRNRPACSRVVALGTQMKTKESNSWFIFTVAPKREATAEEIAVCRKWYDVFAKKAGEAAAQQEGEESVPF